MEKNALSLKQVINRLVIVQLLWSFFAGKILTPIMSVLEPELSSHGFLFLYDLIFYMAQLFLYLIPLVLLLGKPKKPAVPHGPSHSKKQVLCWAFIGIGSYFLFQTMLEYVGLNQLLHESFQRVTSYSVWKYVWLFLFSALREEIVYRVCFCGFLAPYGRTAAILISSYLFAVQHVTFLGVSQTFLFGIVTGYIYLETGKIIYPYLLHFFTNVFFSIYFNFYIQYFPDNDFDLLIIAILSLGMIVIPAFVLAHGRNKENQPSNLFFGKTLTGFLSSLKEIFKNYFTVPSMIVMHFIFLLMGFFALSDVL